MKDKYTIKSRVKQSMIDFDSWFLMAHGSHGCNARPNVPSGMGGDLRSFFWSKGNPFCGEK